MVDIDLDQTKVMTNDNDWSKETGAGARKLQVEQEQWRWSKNTEAGARKLELEHDGRELEQVKECVYLGPRLTATSSQRKGGGCKHYDSDNSRLCGVNIILNMKNKVVLLRSLVI